MHMVSPWKCLLSVVDIWWFVIILTLIIFHSLERIIYHHASHPWSKNKILIWMVRFLYRSLVRYVTSSDCIILYLISMLNGKRLQNALFAHVIQSLLVLLEHMLDVHREWHLRMPLKMLDVIHETNSRYIYMLITRSNVHLANGKCENLYFEWELRRVYIYISSHQNFVNSEYIWDSSHKKSRCLPCP